MSVKRLERFCLFEFPATHLRDVASNNASECAAGSAEFNFYKIKERRATEKKRPRQARGLGGKNSQSLFSPRLSVCKFLSCFSETSNLRLSRGARPSLCVFDGVFEQVPNELHLKHSRRGLLPGSCFQKLCLSLLADFSSQSAF